MATSNGRYLTFAMKAMADITGTLLLPPLVAVALRGLYRQSDFAQPLFVVSLLVVLVFSLIVVVTKIRRYGQTYQELISADGQHDSSDLESGGSGS